MQLAALALACHQIVCAVVAQATEPPRPPQPAVAPEVAHPHPEAPHRGTEPQHGRVCFNAAETREKIAARGLSEPFRLLRSAAGRLQGEALRAKLCRWNDDFIYEIALLRRDGRVVHVFLNATSGKSVGAYNEH